MSTAFSNPNEIYASPVFSDGQTFANVESKAAFVQGSRLMTEMMVADGNNWAPGQPDVSDDELISAALCGDQRAFGELCGRHSSMTKRKILRIVRNQEDAEDIMQDTLLRAYTHLSSFRRSCRFSTWLTTIGVNSALMLMRKRKVRREISATANSSDESRSEVREPVDRSLGPEGAYLRQQTTLLVRRAVERLDPSLRSVVKHYYGSEYSLEESASQDGFLLCLARSDNPRKNAQHWIHGRH